MGEVEELKMNGLIVNEVKGEKKNLFGKKKYFHEIAFERDTRQKAEPSKTAMTNGNVWLLLFSWLVIPSCSGSKTIQ